MANHYTTRLSTTAPRVGGLISMPGVRSTNPMVQAQITAAQKKREEEEREAARQAAERAAQAAIVQRKTTNTGVQNAMAGLGAAPEVTPAAARLKSTNPLVQMMLDDKYAREDAAYSAWESQRKARQAARAEEVKRAGGIYATLPQNADFAALSAARGDVSDPTYRYVNNENNYRESAAGKRNLTNDRRKLQFLTADEVKTYNYLYNKDAYGFGQRLAQDYLYSLSNELDRRQAEDEEKKNREFAQEHPFAASAASVPDSVIGGVSSAVDLGLQGAKKLITGEDINYNSRYQQFGRRAEDVRGTVSENIDSPVGRFFYDVGMSAADSLAAGYTGLGGAALGLSAGASAARDAASRGASDGQALLQGAAAGIAEGLFEKVSIGNLKAMKDIPVTGVKSVVKNVLKSMGVNASEEAATELANVLTDRVIMGDMSNYRTSVEAYKAAGMSDGQAKGKAALDALGQVGMAALSGAVMGGVFGGIGSVQSGVENVMAGAAINRAGDAQTVLDAGSAQVRGTDAKQLADRLAEKQAGGDPLRNAEIGALARETAIQEARNRDALGKDLPLFDGSSAAVRASAAALKRAGRAMGRDVYFYRDVPEVGGYAEGGAVWLNLDASDPMAQVFAHELTHTAEGAAIYDELRTLAMSTMSEKELADAKEKKQDAYRTFAWKTGRVGQALDDAGAEAEVVADWAANKLFSDEAAIAELARRNQSAALRVYDRVREWAASARGDEERAFLGRAQRLYAQAIRQTRGDANAERQSKIVELQDGRKYVRADRQVITGNNPNDWGDQVELYINQKIRNGDDVVLQADDGTILLLTKDTEGKASFRNYVRDANGRLRPLTDREYETKLNAETHIDELASVSRKGEKNIPDEFGLHGDLAQNGWNYRTAFFEDFDGEYYKTTISVAQGPDGNVVYNIGKIEKRSKPSFSGSSVNNGARWGNASFDNSIPQIGADSNTSAQDVTELSQSGRKWSISAPKIGKSMLQKNTEELFKRNKEYRAAANGEVLEAMAENINVDQYKYMVKKTKCVYDLTDGFRYDEAWDILSFMSYQFGYNGRSASSAKQIALEMIEQAKRDGYLMESQEGFLALTQKGLERAYAGNVPEDVQELRNLFDEGEHEQDVRWIIEDTEDEQKAEANKQVTAEESVEEPMQEKTQEVSTEPEKLANAEHQEVNEPIAEETEADREDATEAPQESEQERQQRAETNYQYMIDRMMERAANRDVFGDAYLGVSGKIGDLLRREAENVKTPKAAEPGRAFALGGSMAERGITREMLNVRAAEAMGKIENHARDDIGFALGLSYWADHTESNAAIERLITQYLWNGQYAVSEADAQRRTNEAFDALFADAEEKNRAFYDKYKNLSDVIAQYIGYDRADAKKKYREITKRGTLEGFSLSDESIAVAYGALREKAPELFPEREGAGEQLKRMLQIASGIEQIKYRMDKMATEAGHLHWVMRAKVDFANAINDTLREAELVRRYAEDKRSRAEEEAEVPTDPMDLVEVSAKVRDLKREADRLANRYLFTEDDKAVIDRLMRGELKRSEVVSPNKAGIFAVYDKLAEAEAANQVIKKYNARRRAQLDDLADTSLGDLEKTRDKAAGLQYSTNTMERNVADVFRDKEAAKAVRQNFFDVVHRATAAMTRAQNAFNARVAALNISQKADKGNRDSEAYVVQLMGEAQDSLAQYKKKERDGIEPEQINGKTKADWEGVIADIRAANPNMDWAKIDDAIGEFRAIYNELFEQMNLVRVTNGYPPIDYRRGYFPHFQKNEPDTVFGKLMAGLGVKAEVTPLPTSINGMTDKFKPGISWFSHAQARTGFATDYDAIEGYQQYVRGALRVIYQTENIQRLRALERRIRYATTDEGMKERIKAKQAELDANDALSEDEKIEIMQNLYAQGRFTLSNFCNELSEYTNILAGKRSRLDRGMESLIGRNAYNVLKTLNNRLGANMVAANIGSAMTNFIPLQQGYAQLGARRLMRGMWDTVKAIAQDDNFAARSDFLTNRRGSTTIGDTVKDRVFAAAGWMMETVDSLTSETLVRARYAQNIKAGLSQEAALEEADRWAAKVMGDRSIGAMPTIFHATNPVVKVFTQFQLEVANNVGYIFKDLPKDAAKKGKGELAKLLLKYVLSAWLFNELYEYIFGRRPALDPISWINEASGDLTGYELPNLYELGTEAMNGKLDAEDFQTKREGIYPAAANLFKNVAEQVPYVGGILPMFVDDVDGRLPISSAVPNLPNIAKAFDKERAWQDRAELAYKELVKPVAYLAMPFGGGQLKKAFEGIVAAVQGGSYSYNTQGEKVLQYPIVADTAIGTAKNYVQAGVFGKSSFSSAQDWVDSGFDSFSAKETAIYRGLLDVGVSGKEAYAAVRQLSDIQKNDEQTAAELKRQALRDMTLSEDAKAVIYYGMLATEKEQVLLDAFEDENFRTARAAMLLCDMRDAKTTAEERKLLADARGLGDVEKVMIYREKISTAWDDEIAAMHEAGFMFDDFLEAQNMLAEYEERTETKQERDNMFIDWAISRGYKLEDRFVMMDCFGVSTQLKKETQKKKFGLTLPSLPQIKLPEIKKPSLPQISLPGFGG